MALIQKLSKKKNYIAIFLLVCLMVNLIVLYRKDYHSKSSVHLELSFEAETFHDIDAKDKQPTQLNQKKHKMFVDRQMKTISSPKICHERQHQHFPLCQDKLQYLQMAWQLKCFKEVHQVDGSKCSHLKYLSEIEPYCAPMSYGSGNSVSNALATMNFSLDEFLNLLPMPNFEWMRGRAKQLWPDWVVAGENFQKYRQKWEKKKVFVFMGSFGFQPHLLRAAGHGGPLGELIQWTDLLASLFVLGYDVQLSLNASEFRLEKDVDGCASKSTKRHADLIYTDNNGAVMLYNEFGSGSMAKYRCAFRLLDSFGTFVEFNYPGYPFEIPGGRSGWADHNVLPKQTMTLYPHTHDNSFLGFVIGSSDNLKSIDVSKKKPIALIYAKLSSYFQGFYDYLKIVSEYFELHATTIEIDGSPIPKYVINHGSVSGAEVKKLLIKSKLFVGVGFPYEGPGPMEAMAAGSVYLQPKFDIPRNKLNEEFFAGKPTLRKLSSQSPYMEEFIGEPYCYTINISDTTILRKTLEHIKQMEPLKPKIPREFTNEGMLERVHVFTHHMDFCNPDAPRWPPINHLKVVLTASTGMSCKEACMKKGMVCERDYFHDINTKDDIESISKIACKKVNDVMFLHAPSYDPVSNICNIQKHGQLFSCMHAEKNVMRVCPCREFLKEQSALCPNCL